MVRTYLKKRNEPSVPEGVIQEAFRAVQERRLSLRVAASRYGMTHRALHHRIKKISNGDDAIGLICLPHITQFGKFSMKTRS